MTPPIPLRVPDPPPGAEPVAWMMLVAGAALAVLVLRLLRRRMGRPLPAPLAVLTALLAAVGILGAAELAVRDYEALKGTSAWLQTPNVIWMLAPNMEHAPVGPPERRTWVSTNSLGLRDEELPAERRPDEFRVLALGDSWTLGVEMTPAQTWVKRLQEKLQKRHPDRKVTVLNAGQNGFSYLQGYHLARYLVPLYQPDLVLAGGFVPVSQREIAAMEELESADPRVDEAMRTLNQSRLYRVLRQRFAPRFPARPKDSDPSPRHVYSGSVTYAQAMARYFHDQGIPAVMFNHAFAGDGEDYWYARPIQPILKSVPDLPGLAIIEILPGWDAASSGLLLEHDPTHPNALGHEAMAEALDRFLASPAAPLP